MKLGFSLPLAGAWATPASQAAVARHAEALGYHSLWVFQRLLYALAPQNDYHPCPASPGRGPSSRWPTRSSRSPTSPA